MLLILMNTLIAKNIKIHLRNILAMFAKKISTAHFENYA